MITASRFESVVGQIIRFNEDGTNLHEYDHTIEVRNEEIERTQEDGYWQTPDFLGKGMYSLQGILTGNSAGDLARLRGQMMGAFQPAAFLGTKYTGVLYITFDTYPAEEVFAICNMDGNLPSMPKVGSEGPSLCQYQVALKSFDARMYSTDQQVVTVGAPTHTGGFTLPVVPPFTTGSPPLGGQIDLFNAGNAPTYLVIQVYGALTNPSFTLLFGGKEYRLQFNNLTLGDTDVMTIDMQNLRVTTNTGGDLFGRVADGSNWFMLPPGSCEVDFNAFDASAGAKAVYTYRNAYLIP